MYLELLKKHNISPNFWCSEEYWKRAGWVERNKEHGKTGLTESWIENTAGEIMLPLIFENGKIDNFQPFWAGYSNIPIPDRNNIKFLDHEFIYKPMENISDKDMPGKAWKTTRKNIHKIKREYGDLLIDIIFPEVESKIEKLLLKWAGSKEIHDAELMTNYVLNGDHRKGLYIKGKLVGVIVWDFNNTHINFRYCLVEDLPGLSDYARILFRTYIYYLYGSKVLINDGGSLDNPDLYKYKERLCPIRINKIYTTL